MDKIQVMDGVGRPAGQAISQGPTSRAKLARASKAARHPASHQETPTVTASRTRFQGDLAVDEINCAHPVDAGAIDCTNRVIATSPGKYAEYLAPIVRTTASANSAIHAFSLRTMIFSLPEKKRLQVAANLQRHLETYMIPLMSK